ncbi:uncharacterized protein FSUBG_6295 [Fusarium subglutinans]|uniref:GOLD domain-containing protein n=1 Tax=Gibberella subglutinans TaxID=42677 RepID=A0A8H5V2K8_GIBSU|nr:uncharacterized protein FSUBG_6295 [Fusarium subglutinans]KAF5605959.1 hypothetical protein FSUBG_6295 [Fusarium subglutinans]
MSDYSPTSSSYETAPISPSETLYNTKNRIRFASRGITDAVGILVPRNVQQWQLDTALAPAKGTTSQLEASLYKATRELDHEVTGLFYEMDAIRRLRTEDLKRAQRRHNQTLLFCVLLVLVGVLGSWVLQHRGKELFELFDY